MLSNHIFAQILVALGFLSLYASALPVANPDTQGALIKAERATDTFWLANISRRGKATFNTNSGYQIFRNVKDFGAIGDGVHDDTAAINAAVTTGARCGQGCDSSTTTPAIVYFPPGTYLVSSPIIQYYYTQFIGSATMLPVLKAAPNFLGIAMIDSDPYIPSGGQWYTNQNNFFRQVRNIVFDMTGVAPTTGVTGVHWQVAQATSLQNLHFLMSSASGTQHQGIYMENGSGGFLSDLTFTGGKLGALFGNQQFTTRNLKFTGCQTAISLIWDWGWTFKSLDIENCGLGIDMSVSDGTVNAGSVVVLDSKFINVPLAIKISRANRSDGAGSLILDNVSYNNVPTLVRSVNGAVSLNGGTGQIVSWGTGRAYTSNNNYQGVAFTGTLPATARKPGNLLDASGKIYERSRPQYETLPLSKFFSAKAAGCVGDGVTDDTTCLQNLINRQAGTGNVVFLDHGVYLITRTLIIPAGSKITGEIWATIMSSGSTWANMANPQPVVQVGSVGSTGAVELTDIIVQTQGPAPGAIGIQWNMGGGQGQSGMWDVHVRIGGSAGTHLQSDTCAKNPKQSSPNPACYGAFMLVHISKGAVVYLENNWFWTADHELDQVDHQQISIYVGRGVLVESQGPVWMYGTSAEHNTLYNFEFSRASNVFAGMIQSETPYFQPNPITTTPFPPIVSPWNDPTFSNCAPGDSTCLLSWGLAIRSSSNILIYGAGLYSFYYNYDQKSCQKNMVLVDGTNSNDYIYNLNTKAATYMVSVNGQGTIKQTDNRSTFTSDVALFAVV